MAKGEEVKTAKALKTKKDLKDARKNAKIELQEGENKKDFITRLGKQVCGETFTLPTVL
jgi:hypothetical protein